MPRQYGRILASIWHDEDFRALNDHSQRLYFLILSQPDLTMCGVITPALGRWSSTCSNGSIAKTRTALGALADKRFVVVDDQTDEVWVRSLVHHDLSLDIPNVWVGISHAFVSIASKPIRKGFIQELRKEFPEGFPEWKKDNPEERMDEVFVKAFLNP